MSEQNFNTVKFPCPMEGCSYGAEFRWFTWTEATAVEPSWFKPYFDALTSSFYHHIQDHHDGHVVGCPRKLDENDYCDCQMIRATGKTFEQLKEELSNEL